MMSVVFCFVLFLSASFQGSFPLHARSIPRSDEQQ